MSPAGQARGIHGNVSCMYILFSGLKCYCGSSEKNSVNRDGVESEALCGTNDLVCMFLY